MVQLNNKGTNHCFNYWTWARTDVDDLGSPNLAWNAAKFSVRGIATAFLTDLFLIVDTPTMSMGSRNAKMNHFLVPTVMLTIFGTFLETLIDQYVWPLDRKIRLAKEPNLWSVFT